LASGPPPPYKKGWERNYVTFNLSLFLSVSLGFFWKFCAWEKQKNRGESSPSGVGNTIHGFGYGQTWHSIYISPECALCVLRLSLWHLLHTWITSTFSYQMKYDGATEMWNAFPVPCLKTSPVRFIAPRWWPNVH